MEYKKAADIMFPDALWIKSHKKGGKYALVMHCGRGRTVVLYETLALAIGGKRFADVFGCGGFRKCIGDHTIIDIMEAT